MSNTKNNHYIPQCYLEGWEIPDAEPAKQIGIYRKDTSYEAKPIVRTAKLRKFYALRLEKELQKIESRFGQAMARLRVRDSLEPRHRRAMVEFIVTLLRRNPVGHERAKKMLVKLIPRSEKRVISNFWALINASDGSPMDKLILGVAWEFTARDIYRKLQDRIPKDFFADITLRRLELFETTIDELSWIIYTCSGEDRFVTCDNPVVMPDERLEKTARMILPLGDRICLVAQRGEDDLKYATADQKMVGELNSRIIASASKEVYTSGEYLKPDVLKPFGTQIWLEDG